MTSRRWVLLITLSVSIVGFFVDRLFLGEPETAEAKPAVTPQPSPPPEESNKKPVAPATPDPSLAYLERLADPGPSRDVFAPSRSWLNAQKKKEAAEKEEREAEKGPKPGSPEAFVAAHQLQATTVMAGGGLAVVDGECLSIGDTLDGFRLVRVAAGEVEFQHDQDRAILTLPAVPGLNPKGTASAPPKNKPAPSKSHADPSSP
jgi:hypothetical protein